MEDVCARVMASVLDEMIDASTGRGEGVDPWITRQCQHAEQWYYSHCMAVRENMPLTLDVVDTN